MKPILISSTTIVAMTVAGVGVTNATLTAPRPATNNVSNACKLDLKVDNTCYYNGQACTNGFFGGQPNASPNPTNRCSCAWSAKNLGKDDLFFNLTDLKPGDWEEDTISLHVNNPAWVCLDMAITSSGNKELDKELQFAFWVDDGDNVFEQDELNKVLFHGPAHFVLNQSNVTLADSAGSLFNSSGGPLQPGKTYYIGKYFCYGDKTPAPLPQDGLGKTGHNGPDVRGSGFNCDGSKVGNISQADKLTANISFRAIQASGNPHFLCNPK